MNRRRIGRVVAAVVALMLVILVSRGVALAAAPGNPFDQVLDKLDAIIGMLTPTPPEPEGEVTIASAPTLIDGSSRVACLIANLGTDALNADVFIRELDGDLIGGGFELHVVPGGTNGVGGSPTNDSITARCEFTIDQPATTVRALMRVEHEAGQIAIVEMR